MTTSRLLAILGLVAVGLAASSAADVLELRDGETLAGSYRGGDDEVVKFETPQGLLLVPLSKVAGLRFGETPPASEPTEPPVPQAAPPPPQAARATPPAPRPSPPKPAETPPTPVAPAAPVAQRVVVPAGTLLRVRIADSLDPRRSAQGDRFAALLDEPLVADGLRIAPEHSRVYGVVSEARTTGPVVNRLQLELTELQISGRRLPIVTGTQQPVASATGPDAPADAEPPQTARLASGTLLEFRLLQPLEVQVVRKGR